MTAEALPAIVELAAPRRWSRPIWLTMPAIIGGSVVILWIVVALTIPFWAPYDPLQPVGERLAEPTFSHPLGTDNLGRDVFTRTMYGSRTALPIATFVIFGSVLVGGVIGTISGFAGGWVDAFLMRFADMTLAFPAILLAITVTAYLGRELHNIMIAIIVVAWPVYARLLRAQVLVVREFQFVEAANALGASRVRVLLRHIMPSAITPILITATMDFGQVILLAAALSFIGLGAKPPTPEWGVMITDGSRFFYQWWIAAGPGIAIFSVALAANFVGDGIRDGLDPRTREHR
jgi:peptide/nickel transport system permease protein